MRTMTAFLINTGEKEIAETTANSFWGVSMTLIKHSPCMSNHAMAFSYISVLCFGGVHFEFLRKYLIKKFIVYLMVSFGSLPIKM